MRSLPSPAPRSVPVALRSGMPSGPRAGRELLLLQASDWPFVIHTHGAVDYGIQRFSGHCTRFDRATHIAEELARGNGIGEIERVQLAEMDLHDSVFPNIDLNWWM